MLAHVNYSCRFLLGVSVFNGNLLSSTPRKKLISASSRLQKMCVCVCVCPRRGLSTHRARPSEGQGSRLGLDESLALVDGKACEHGRGGDGCLITHVTSSYFGKT